MDAKTMTKTDTDLKLKNKVNSMRNLILEKLTMNICVGNDKDKMEKAKLLIEKLTNRKPVFTKAKRRIAQFQIRPGLPIGYKVTLRGKDAEKFLKWILESKGNKLKGSSIDKYGNFSVGFHEYLDLNGIKYDADIGILGFEIMVTFTRPGFRIKQRLYKRSKIPSRHRTTKEEVIDFLTKKFKVEVL